ncbi:glycoside hydrolase family 2 TIM barrel-domain containing protein [Paenibacillus radicis (ex Xue et al. 2023)]|uniref:Beta-galactosidase n=1 Tax=Paenibacillus radicis (ex Xue et al. 2023) TaxID=2972489 RepID=A0ABT1YBJ7_9BACL|nr:glycoside hydrolase family 2 TIM barrel-domain containing protein [Paenibacillus radicis (ex Xue et al. 2023)]MCR8630571.1 S-layer homology domain-containing protein [Paenibacillus radicis (ex Xue et al. 2023)]
MKARPPKSLLLCLICCALVFSVFPAIAPEKAQAAIEPAPVETQVQYLSGTDKDHTVNWDFFVTNGSKSGSWTTIPVPSMWEMQGFGNLGYGFSTSSEQGLYKRNFNVPASWQGQRVNLVFEGSMTDTDVKINGQSTGAVHQGAFYRFKYDVTDKLVYGQSNLLEATVSKTSANGSVNRAERQSDFWIFGGIYRPVYLEVTPVQAIGRTAINAKADGSFAVDVYVDNITDADKVVAQIQTLDGQNVGAPFTASVGPGITSRRLKTTVANPKLWSAETPNLYKVVVSLQKQGVDIHKTTERFGFRTVEVKQGDGIYVNGVKVIFKGANRAAFWPDSGRTLTPEIDRGDIMLMKEMNMNAVRSSHYPPDKSFLELCDELGMYVIDELTGWQKSYDTTVGTKLVNEMIPRDVNHPSIIFWANGNEGGWNTDLDPMFKSLDPQQRPVLHPWTLNDNIDTDHYENYQSTKEKIEVKPNIFMPTEYLHAMYDGGGGAGLNDYWKLMGDASKPKAAGGFIWALLDEGVKKADGTIDTAGNAAPDGIVGPYREKEGSYFTIKDIFSPVQLTDSDNLEKSFPAGFTGAISLANSYQFKNLNQLKFTWKLLNFNNPSNSELGYTVGESGEAAGPNVAPGAKGLMQLSLPGTWKNNDALTVTVQDETGITITSWTWMIKKAFDFRSRLVDASKGSGTATALEGSSQIVVAAGATVLKFDKATGKLADVRQDGKSVSFNNGPVLAAGTQAFKDIAVSSSGNDQVVQVNYTGNMKYAKWTIHPSGWVDLEYKYNLNGDYDNIGVSFSYPETNVNGISWLGKGPFHVYKNRMRGPSFGVWNKLYSDSTKRWQFPEFNGYYSDTYMAVLKTNQGNITMASKDEHLFLRLFNPVFSYDNADAGGAVALMPIGDISFLDGISGMGNKFDTPAGAGPEGEKNKAAGDYTRTISFKFDTSGVASEPAGDVNLALNKLKDYSTQENASGSAAALAVDGDAITKWASAGATTDFPQWIELDLQTINTIKRLEVVPQGSRAYQYKIEAKQKEEDNYTTIVNRTTNTTGSVTFVDDLAIPVKARFVKLTFTGISPAASTKFASIYEFRVIGPKLFIPAQPTGLNVVTKSDDSIVLNWSSVSSATSYNVFRSTSARDKFVQVNTAPVTSTTFSDTGLNGKKYLYKVVAVNEAGESVPSDAAPAAAMLYGPAKVAAGQSFDLTWAVNGVTQSVYQQVYSHSMVVQFDSTKLNLVSASPLDSKLTVADKRELSPGKVQITTATTGAGSSVSANGELLKFTFSTKAVPQETNAQVSLSNVLLSSTGGSFTLSGMQYEITIQNQALDKTSLLTAIANAQNKLALAVEGEIVGQYPAGSKAVLQTAVDQAGLTANNAAVFQSEVDAAKAKLDAAVAIFEAQIVKRVSSGNSSSPPSGGGGGAGGGGLAPAATAAESKETSAGSISPQVKLDQATGAAQAKIDASTWDRALSEAKADTSAKKTVVVSIQETQGARSYVTQLPAAAVNGSSSNVQLKLATPLATITTPGNLFKESELSVDEVELHVGKVDTSKWDEGLKNQIGSRPVIDLSIHSGGSIIPWSNPNAPITVSIPYSPSASELTDSEHIVIWYVDGQGMPTTVSNGKYDSLTGMVTFSVTHFSTYAVGFVKKTFEDVAALDWAKKQIEVLASKGIVQGTSDHLFAPEEQVSRADFLLLLVRTLELKGTLGSTFADVQSKAYYAEALQVARGLGITQGGDGNLFRPQDPITREDMMVLTERALKAAKKSSSQVAAAQAAPFQDAADISAYAANSVNILVEMGLVQGYNQSIYPQNTTNRAQAAVLMYNIYRLGN